jgi:thiamine-monophosphate kinase
MSSEPGNTVSTVGEFGLIDRLLAVLPPETVAGPDLRLGIGDDAAIWRPSPGHELVITTDSLVEQVHFRLDWTDWTSLGHKSLAVNLSDLAAMGATPRLAVVTLALRGSEAVADLVSMYEGLGSLAKRCGVLLAGGDIVRSPNALVIHVTAIGELSEGTALTRAAARAGDLIAVSGTLGASAAGLRLLADGFTEVDSSPATASTLIAAHLRPEPRVPLGQLLRRLGVATAMDLSDGLLGDLPKILIRSAVSAEIEVDRLPVPAAVRALFPDDWLELALRGGEDYELLICASPEVMAECVRQAASVGATLTVIGRIVDPAGGPPELVVRDSDGTAIEIESGAFDHFV